VATPRQVVEAAPEVAQVLQEQGAPVDSVMVEIEPAESEASEAGAPIYSEDFRMVPQSTEQQPDTAVNLPAEPQAPDLAERTDQNARPSLVRKVRDWLTRAA